MDKLVAEDREATSQKVVEDQFFSARSNSS